MDRKVVLVTGGGEGIGRATAVEFATQGALTVVCDISEDAGETTVDAIRDLGGDGLFVRADVSIASEVETVIDEARRAFGGLDCAHNNAGIVGPAAEITSYPEDAWDRVMAVNLKSVWLCMKYEIAELRRRGGGAIVNTSSIDGVIGNPGFSAYTASKHGVVGLTKVAALENARSGIRVNAVCPGFTDTAMVRSVLERSGGPAPTRETVERLHPLGRFATPAEIANAVVWLCSDAASFVTGVIMPVDGGYIAQ